MFANLRELNHIQNQQIVIAGGSAFQRPLHLEPSLFAYNFNGQEEPERYFSSHFSCLG